MPNTTPIGHFSHTTTSGQVAPRGEYKFTVGGTVTKVARVDGVRQVGSVYAVTGTFYPVAMFGGRVNAMPEAEFLH